MERIFRVIPRDEELEPGRYYYYDSWRSLSDEILDSYGKEILRLSNIFENGEPSHMDQILLEELPSGNYPYKFRHSFYVNEDMIFTYVY